MKKSQCILLFLLSILFTSANSVYNVNVATFGAKPDGKTDTTKPFLAAWAVACGSTKSVELYVPQGRYLIGQAIFKGPCKNNATNIKIDGTLVAPTNYWDLENTGYWILFNKVNGVSISGGTLDGQGAGFWACRAAGKNCPNGARSLTFNGARNVNVKGLTSINSQASHIVINGCNNVIMQGLKIVAPDNSPNTDGIHVQTSTGVTITGTSIKTGDDCISIGPGTRNLMIVGVNCGPGHGISIGSLGKDAIEDGVQNVTVKTVTFTGSDNGLVLAKTSASTGFVRGILYQDVIMKNVKNPIIVDQHYCPRNEACPSQNSGIKISQVTYRNIRGSSATPIAMKFDCSVTNPCREMNVINVKLTYQNNPAQSSCLNADGKISSSVSASSCLN